MHELFLGSRQVAVKLLETGALTSVPLDKRVEMLAGSMQAGEIVVCEISLVDFLSEEETCDRARIRRLIIQALDETDREHGTRGASSTPLKFKALADSIEDVAILEVTAVPSCFSDLKVSVPATLFVPLRYFKLLGIGSAEYRQLAMSRDWKANTVDVYELGSRFQNELQEWQMYDSARFRAPQDPAREALAAALGLGEGLERAREQYLFGYAIGNAVGNEHAHLWLPMDLKLEHFVNTGGGIIAHVDHSDDVFLFREPSAEECARSIAPLYQQMSYSLWHAFREGYWDVKRREALDVLALFDGFTVGEILGVYSVRISTEARNKGEWDAALAWSDEAEAAFEMFQREDEAAAEFYLARLKLVRGDIYLRSGDSAQALGQYGSGRRALELLAARGVSCEFEISSALVNSAVAFSELGRTGEARECLLQAKSSASHISTDDPHSQFIMEAIKCGLAGLDT